MPPRGSSHKKALLLLSIISVLLVVLILLLPEREEEASEQAFEEEQRGIEEESEGAVEEARPLKPRVSVVIDDAGYSLRDLQPFIDFPGKLTIAVLPHVTYSSEASRLTADAGKEVILHLPMEPLGDANPGPGAILSTHSSDAIREALEKSFLSVPDAVGVSNHMGSKIMSDSRILRIVMDYLGEEGRFFLDSKTTSDPVAAALARSRGVPFLERSLFLDNDRNEEAIKSLFFDGIELAELHGSAVLIAHVQSPQVVSVLQDIYQELGTGQIELTFLSELLETTGEAP
jgi:polysaccharide deacetylase 2 family uncharacterized protein YibQ